MSMISLADLYLHLSCLIFLMITTKIEIFFLHGLTTLRSNKLINTVMIIINYLHVFPAQRKKKFSTKLIRGLVVNTVGR